MAKITLPCAGAKHTIEENLMINGQAVRIFFVDGDTTGVRYVELANRTAQAICAPLSLLPRLKDWTSHLRRAGVYFLIGQGDVSEPLRVYIGESEDVLARLANHATDKNKDFATHVLAITGKDDNLTKGHIRFLEAKLIQRARKAGRAKLDNSDGRNIPPSLPVGDQAFMGEFEADVCMLVGVIGYRFLDELDPNRSSVPRDRTTRPGPNTDVYMFEGTDFSGRMVITGEGFVLLKGSRLSQSVTRSVDAGTKRRRKLELDAGSFADEDDMLITNRNLLFTSSSGAACFVAGSSRSGPKEWQSNGRTLREIEAAQAAELLNGQDSAAVSDG